MFSFQDQINITLNFTRHNSTIINNSITNNLTSNFVNKTDSAQPTHIWNFNSWVWLTILALLILIENGLVCLAFVVNKKLRKRQANIMVFSQACADLINSILFVPTYTVGKYNNKPGIAPYVICYVLFVSLFNLFILALDRYLALIKPLIHHIVMDVRRTVKVVLSIWIIPLFLTLVPLFWATNSFSKLSHRIYLGFLWLIMFSLCLSMIIMYIFLYRSARRTIRRRTNTIASLNQQKDRIAKVKKELRITHLFGLLLVFFILAYLPILYMNFMDVLDKVEWIPLILEDLSLYSLVLNSVLNPILCILLKKDYQNVVRRIVCLDWLKRHEANSFDSNASYKTDFEMVDYGTDDNSKKKKEKWLNTPPPMDGNSSWERRKLCSPNQIEKRTETQPEASAPDEIMIARILEDVDHC